MRNTIDTIQRSLYTLFNLLPIVVMSTLLTVGFGLGNYGMITILLGQFTVSVTVFLIRLFSTNEGQLYSLFPGETSKQFPSIWMANISFFFGCLFSSAYSVYTRTPTNAETSDSDATINSKVKNRKSRTMMIMVAGALLGVFLLGYRMWAEGLGISSLLGSLLGVGIGAIGVVAWATIIKQPNFGTNNMDIFGISQQLISVTKTDVKTMCQLEALASQ